MMSVLPLGFTISDAHFVDQWNEVGADMVPGPPQHTSIIRPCCVDSKQVKFHSFQRRQTIHSATAIDVYRINAR
jgi:hypothetical protein